MNFIKLFSSLALTCLCVFVSCKKDDFHAADAAVNIPGGVSGVTAFNLKRLMEKADFEQVKRMSFYQEMVSQAGKESPALAAALLNPEQSGIDLDKNLYIALEPDPENPESIMGYVLLSLKNPADFEKIIHSGSVKVVSEGEVKIIENKSNPALAWNKHLLVMGFGNGNNSSTKEKVAAVFSMPKDKSIVANKEFRKAMDNNHDFHSWFTTNALAANNTADLALSMIDIDPEALQNNYIHSYADFENGKVVGHADFFMNKALGKDFIGRFFKEEVKTDFSKYLAGENLAFATVVALDLKGIDQFLSERPQSRSYAEFVMKESGLKMKDLLEVFSGDMLVAGFRNADDILVAANVRDRGKATEILQNAVGKKKLKMVEQDMYKVVSLGGEDFTLTVNRGLGFLLLKDGMLFFSNHQTVLDRLKKGESAVSSAQKELWKSFDHKTLGSWIQFGGANNWLGGIQGDWLQHVHFTVDGKGADFLLKTSDENSNSLKSVFQLIEEAHRQRQEKESEAL